MKIFIIGNYVDFTICKVKSSISWGESCIASEITSTIGNDAAIVAMVLAKLGQPVTYGLLNPITEILAKKMNVLGIQIQNLEISNSGGKTLMIEDASEKRTFISAYDTVNTRYSIPSDTQYIYFDLYDENIENLEYLITQLVDRQNIGLFFNLSSSNIENKCILLAQYHIDNVFIQFSSDKELAESMIATVSQILPRAILIATCGCHGSYLAYSNYSRYLPADVSEENSILGAGAFFSAFFLNVLFHEQSLPIAQKYASKYVGILCKKGITVLIDTINYFNEECISFE